MSATMLKPWTDVVTLHPDVESGDLVEAVFAIVFGAGAPDDPTLPVVSRAAQEAYGIGFGARSQAEWHPSTVRPFEKLTA